MSKKSFVLGAVCGYVLGTRAGRGQYEKMKKMCTGVWKSTPVQGLVHRADMTVGDMVRAEGSRLTDQVAAAVKQKINTVGRHTVGATPSAPPPCD